MCQHLINRAVEFAYGLLTVNEQNNGITPERKEEIANLVLRGQYAAIERDDFLRALENYVPVIFEERAAFVISEQVENQRKWLTAEMKEPSQRVFWCQYEQKMRDISGLPSGVRERIDLDTDKILEFMGDPKVETLQTKGLVIGDVQSGKTSNFTGLITKAADAGYKVIIVATGILEVLRKQTQERLERDFVGLPSDGNSLQFPRNTRVLVNTKTTCSADFNQKCHPSAGEHPVLFVIKKNVHILQHLCNHINANLDQYRNRPLLFIDDEADSASVNTNESDINTSPTETNRLIRNILELFPRSSYVGYTATPFANVFIDPFSSQVVEKGISEGEALHARDLFPADFIYLLPSSPEYIGAEKLFGLGDEEENDLAVKTLRLLPDEGEEHEFMEKMRALYRGQKAENPELPASLKKALCTYILACAVHKVRGRGNKFSGMLIHVSHLRDIQNRVFNKVRTLLHSLLNSLRLYAGDAENYCRVDALCAIREAWNEQYEGRIPESWKEVSKHFCDEDFLNKFTSFKVNSDKEADLSLELRDFDYSRMPEGTAAIVVGGNCLARGITIEGLTVTYFLRRSVTYDSLMQMGRWFGYRKGYEDICRVFITQGIADFFSQIAIATRELKDSIQEMNNRRMTPLTFGLKVRNGAGGLNICSAIKMRKATRVYDDSTADLSGRMHETYILPADAETLSRNNEKMQRFIRKLDARHTRYQWQDGDVFPRDSRLLWKSVPTSELLPFLRSLQGLHWTNRATEAQGRIWDGLLLNYLEGYEVIDICLASLRDDEENKELKISDNIRIFPMRRNPRKNHPLGDDIRLNSARFFSKGDDMGHITLEQKEKLLSEFSKKKLADLGANAFCTLDGRKPLLVLGFAWLPETYSDLKLDKGEKLSRNHDERLTKLVCGFGVSCPGYDEKSHRKLVSYMGNLIHLAYSRPESGSDAE